MKRNITNRDVTDDVMGISSDNSRIPIGNGKVINPGDCSAFWEHSREACPALYAGVYDGVPEVTERL